MKPYCAFAVPGIPRPGGSKTGLPYVRDVLRVPDALYTVQQVRKYIRACVRIGVSVKESGKHTAEWREHVATAARRLRLPKPEAGFAYVVRFEFFMPRAQSHLRSSGEVKPTAPRRPTAKPDLLKLARAAEDALTGILWHDDAEITGERLFKRYGRRPGVKITVWRMPNQPSCKGSD